MAKGISFFFLFHSIVFLLMGSPRENTEIVRHRGSYLRIDFILRNIMGKPQAESYRIPWRDVTGIELHEGISCRFVSFSQMKVEILKIAGIIIFTEICLTKGMYLLIIIYSNIQLFILT